MQRRNLVKPGKFQVLNDYSLRRMLYSALIHLLEQYIY